MIKKTCGTCLLIFLILPLTGFAEPVQVLILSGQNNHNWKDTTFWLHKALDGTGRFKVQVTESPETLDAPALKDIDVIVSNWNSFMEDGVKTWPEAARKALLSFVAGGKGFVSVHAGSSSFYDWPEYQELVMTYWDHGVTGHGPHHHFDVTCDADHPITRGISRFIAFDELWHNVPVPEEARILATAFSSKEKGGSGEEVPVLLVRGYGRGRSVNLLLGHDGRAMRCFGFDRLFTHSVEWAATGDVAKTWDEGGFITEPVPEKEPDWNVPARLGENIAAKARIESLFNHPQDGQGKPAPAAIDSDKGTYWDEEDGKETYGLRLIWPEAVTIDSLGIIAWGHHQYAPKSFEVIADGKGIKTVTEAVYRDTRFWVDLPDITCTTLELKITACYPQSPAIRELSVLAPLK